MRNQRLATLLLLLAAATASACGSQGTTGVVAADTQDTGPPDTGPKDTGGPGETTPSDLTPDSPADAADALDLLLPDAADAADGAQFGEWNKPCASNADCKSGFCIQIADLEWVCTITCVEECPKDWLCQGMVIGPDVNFVCVPPGGKSCQPCATDADCLYKGDLCVPVGKSGSFCLTACEEAKCPDHFTCTSLDVDGADAPADLCFPDTESCVCNFELDGTSKECSVSNDFGKCYGEQTCNGPDGWSECGANTPAPEECDGKDQDCDGTVDEGLDPKPCLKSGPDGTCKGTQTCAGEQGWICDAADPAPEACDGLDNDCDDDVDDGFPDTDFDGDADCVDLDDDGDGVMDPVDNCPDVMNVGQSDLDGDKIGDACDDDDDGDTAPDSADNCPTVANTDQSDVDGDKLGDKCDDDADGDGAPNQWDCAPLDPTIHPKAEEFCDGVDNNCNMYEDEGFPDNDGDKLADCTDADDDNDGDPDTTDCAPLDPSIGHGVPDLCDGKDNDCSGAPDEGFPDVDKDGVADCVDMDSDGDGVPNAIDNCLLVPNPNQYNNDGDAMGDACDADDDNDGILDDGDGSGTVADNPCANGVTTGCDDNCKDKANQTQSDIDNDLVGDACDPDADGDGVPNDQDCGPLDPDVKPGAKEQCNGIDDNCNSLVDEGFPDTDADKQADCIDEDDDGDKDPDDSDCQPLNPLVYTGAKEVCDGLDSNCNGVPDEGCPPSNVRLYPVLAVVEGITGQFKIRAALGRPAVKTMGGPGVGFKIRFGYPIAK